MIPFTAHNWYMELGKPVQGGFFTLKDQTELTAMQRTEIFINFAIQFMEDM